MLRKSYFFGLALHELKTPTFFTNKKLSIRANLSLLPPKATLFHHKHHKFPPSHNLLFAKNKALLLSFALNPYVVKPERRTDSKPFRRRFARKAGFGSCRRKLLQEYFRQSFESRSQDGVDSLKHGRLAHVRSQFSLFRRSPTHKNLPQATFCTSEHVLFGYFLHDAKSDNPFPFRELSRFSKPQISPPKQRLHTNRIKSFWNFPLCRKFVPAGTAHFVCFFRRLCRLFVLPAATDCRFAATFSYFL